MESAAKPQVTQINVVTRPKEEWLPPVQESPEEYIMRGLAFFTTAQREKFRADALRLLDGKYVSLIDNSVKLVPGAFIPSGERTQ